jgi:WD40 repeat protein/tetratricopeptide (TPR) repeat protein
MPADVPNGSQGNSRWESVLADIQQAEEQGRTVDAQHYLDSFPDLADALRDYFRDREWFARVAPRLAPTAARPAAASPQPELPPGSRFAGYEIIRELGRGGMGIVYHARQLAPQREVALKVIRTDRLADLPADEQRQWLERFHREAQLVASLEQHPNLVTLYEVGEHEGRPFFTMQLVRGGSLAETVGGKESPSRAARLVATVARAVDHVHRRGVLHRDLKPGNILLDERGRPLVSDFGLARRLDQSGSLVAGAIEGTAEYIAPEQARGLPGAVTTAADVYSLGAVLYALLTGQPPFKGANDIETLMLVIGQEPAPPRSLNPRVPRDLEIICLKCLEKEPGRRYPSAAALADDLENWLAGRTINARPAGTIERTWRWCRRNPVPTIAAATVLAVVVVAFVLITDSRNNALILAGEKDKLAKTNGELAQEKTNEANRANTETTRAREEEKKAQREAMHLAFQQARTLADQGEVGRAMHALAHGLALAERGGETDLERLFRANLAAWRYHCHTLRRVLPHPTGVWAVAWSPDGRTLATACWGQPTRLWDLASGKPRGQTIKHEEQWPGRPFNPVNTTGLAFSPDGKTLLTVGYAKVGVWNVETGQRVAELDHIPDLVRSVAFAPDSHTILTGTVQGKAHLWDTSGKQLGDPLSHPGWIEAVGFAPDGRFFATGSKEGGIVVWDAASRRPRVSLEHPGGVTALAFGADRRLLSGGEDRTARLWNLGGPRDPSGARSVVLAHQAPVEAVAFSPDGSLALTGSLDRTARVWDAATGRPIGQPLVHPGEVLTVAFGPDGRTVAMAGGRERGDARVWDLALGNPLGGPLTHAGSILAVAVSPDGRRVATAGRDHMARLWDAHTGEPIGNALPHNGDVNTVIFTPNSQNLVSGGDDSTALFWEAETGKPVVREGVPPFGRKFQFRLDLGSDFPFGFGSGGAGLPKEQRHPGGPFWGPGRGKSNSSRAGDKDGAAVFALAFAPDGKKLVTAGRNGNAVLWDDLQGVVLSPSHSPLQIRRLTEAPSTADLYAATFSPDGRLLALGGEDGAVRVWDATKKYDPGAVLARIQKARLEEKAKPEELARLWDEANSGRLTCAPLQHGGEVVALAFSPDGKLLLTGCSDGTGRLWDVTTGKPRLALKHQGAVVAVAFSPDGQAFVTGSWDGAARVWKTADGTLACPPLAHQGKVLAVAFSRDGRTVLTGSEDWTARLWDAATGQPIGPPLRHQDQVRAVAFRPDCRAAVTAGDDRVGRLWPVPGAAEGSADRIRDWVEARTGMRRLEDGSIQLLEVAEWQPTVARLGDWEAVAPEDRPGWNRQQARAAETAGRWQAARWHLDRLLAADPKAGTLYLRRGYAHAALEHWKEAADDLAVVRRPGEPTTVSAWAAYALVLLKKGDGYGAAGREMLAQFTRPDTPQDAATLIWACCLAPDGLPDYAVPLRLAQQAASLDKNNYPFARAAGAALYRAKDYEGAVKQLEAAGALRKQPSPAVWLLLAMAQQRCGRPDQARDWLHKAADWIARARDSKATADNKDDLTWDRLPWTERLALEFLQAEAKQLIEGDAPKP